MGSRLRFTAKKITPLRIAAKKHHTDVNASRRISAAATTDTTSVLPSVRASFDVETKNGTTVDVMYASTSKTWSAVLLVPG